MAAVTGSGVDLLGVYLNDHLAGATGGLELFRRGFRSQQSTAAGPELRRLTAEVEQDRAALLGFMRALGVPVRPYKVWLGWSAEKAGRLKLNGSLVTRSPLSSVVELEGMTLAVAGKLAGWRTLRGVAAHDDRLDAAQLDGLIERSTGQLEGLERLRLAATAEVFGP